VNILQFDKLISDFRRKLQQAESDATPDSIPVPAAEMVFSPSRVSIKCPHCTIGMAAPPRERASR